METLPIKSRREFDQIINQASDYVSSWIQHHLVDLAAKQLIFGSHEADIYKIGSLILAKTDDNYWMVARDHNDMKFFTDRSSAFFYCLHWIDNEILEANQILELDQTISFLQENCRQYLDKLRKNRNNSAKHSILLSRYRNDSQRINICRQHLKKILSIAKYKKTRKFHELNRH